MDPPFPQNIFDDNVLKAPVNLTAVPFTYEERDCFLGSDNLSIDIFAFDRDSKKMCLHFRNFPVYCCIKLPSRSYDRIIPPGCDIKDSKYEVMPQEVYWDDALCKLLVSRYVKKLRDKGLNTPIFHNYGMYNDIYFYRKGAKDPYLYLYFRSINDRKKFMNACTRYHTFLNEEYQFVKVEIHEMKVSTTMRMMTKRGVRYNQWFNIQGAEIPVGSEYRMCNENVREYFVDFESMNPIPESVSKSWRIYPLLVGFDIETFGHKGPKRFPSYMEIKDPAFIITVDVKRLGHKERKKYCLVYGDCKPIEGTEILKFDNEPDMLIAFGDLITYIGPDFVSSYNGYKFDWPYILGRYSLYHIPEENIPSFGCYKRGPSKIYDQTWESSGYGNNSMTFPIAPGVIMHDMYPSIKRLYKLRKYSLDFVCKKFLKKTKLEMSVKEMFEGFSSYHDGEPDGLDKLTAVCEYCVRDSELVIDLFEKTKLWHYLFALAGEGGVSISDICLRGEQCRCYSQLYSECYRRGYVLSNSMMFDYYYTGGYVGKPIPGVYPYTFTTDFTSLYPSIMQAYNLCYTTFIPIAMWPSIPEECCEIIKISQDEPYEHFSYSRKIDIEAKIKLNESGYPVEITEEEYKYIEQDKTVQQFDLNPENPIENIEFDVEDLTERPDKVTRQYEFRFIKRQYLDGFMPKLEREWVAARKVVKNGIKSLNKELETLEARKDFIDDSNPEAIEKLNQDIEDVKLKIQLSERDINSERFDESVERSKELQDQLKKQQGKLEELYERQRICNSSDIQGEINIIVETIKRIESDLDIEDAKQKSIKIVANSGYGFTGVRQGMLSGVFIAICVTALGRRLVCYANEVLEREFAHLGGKIVYNDTDSSMLSLDIDDSYDLWDLGMQMQDILSGRKEKKLPDGTILPAIEPIFKDPLKMEFEDVCQMCPIKPKYYLKAIRQTDKRKIERTGPFVIEEDGQPLVKKKGVLTAKRGNSKFAMNVYQELSSIVVFMKPIREALMSLSKHAVNLLMDKYDPRDLTKVTELGANYSQENYYMNVFSKNLAAWGQPVRPGDRIEYIIVKTRKELETGKEDKVGDKCREISMWETSPDREPIDYQYYMEKGLETQYDCLFWVGFKQITEDPRFSGVGYQPHCTKAGYTKSQCHFVHFGNPVKMLGAMVKDLLKPSEEVFYEFLKNEYGIVYQPQIYPRNYYIASFIQHELNNIADYLDQSVNFVPETVI